MEAKNRALSPYLAGALTGLLAVLSVFLTTKFLGEPKFLGASTTFVRAVGHIEKEAVPQHVEDNLYFTKTKVKVDWQMLFVAGIFVGALIASVADKSFKLEIVPPMWAERFGRNPLRRAFAAFVGGAIALFGARLAGGCPSGHGMSGMMQLAVSSAVAMACFLIGGLITARILFRGRQ